MDNYSSVYLNQEEPKDKNVKKKQNKNEKNSKGKKSGKKSLSQKNKRLFFVLLVIFGMFIAFALGFFLAEIGFTI